jgi:peptidoglycan-N-acetylglucosamine deacetylase
MSRYNITSTSFLVLLLGSLGLDGLIVIPVWWYIALIVLFSIIVIYGVFVLSTSFFVPVTSSGNSTGVALTFDDGPLMNTEKVLDILAMHGVTATFFCIGNRVQARPDIVRRIDAEGHLVGNHTYWHGTFFDLKSSPMVTRELYDTDVAIFNTIGRRPRFFRPPYGITNPMIAKALRRASYQVIGWSIRSFDTVTRDPDRLFRRITKPLKAGDIILLHDYCDSTIAILPRLLDHIRERGLQVVRVDELIKQRGYV